MAKESKANGVVEAGVEPLNLDEQMKGIEAQIAELRGTYSFLDQLKQQGYSVVPPKQDGEQPAAK